MEVHLDQSDRRPLHRQIYEQIRLQVAAGTLLPGDRLPPQRWLARKLGVNLNTVARAYRDLEQLGVLSTSFGGGTRVRGAALERGADLDENRLVDILGRAVTDVLSLGYSVERVEGALALQLDRWRMLRLASVRTPMRLESLPAGPMLRVAGRLDLAFDLLVEHVRLKRPDMVIVSSNVGSLGGLMALERGEADIASCHILDEETGEYNLPYLRRIAPDTETVLVNLVRRQQGLIVARGNPKGIHGLEDLARPDVTLVNRQRGAETRALLDMRLRALGIRPNSLRGYEHKVGSHSAVAAAVACGTADVGVGVPAAARAMGLDFIPLALERHDLALLAKDYRSPQMAPLLAALRSDAFKTAARDLGGYETSETGKVMATTEACSDHAAVE